MPQIYLPYSPCWALQIDSSSVDGSNDIKNIITSCHDVGSETIEISISTAKLSEIHQESTVQQTTSAIRRSLFTPAVPIHDSSDKSYETPRKQSTCVVHRLP